MILGITNNTCHMSDKWGAVQDLGGAYIFRFGHGLGLNDVGLRPNDVDRSAIRDVMFALHVRRTHHARSAHHSITCPKGKHRSKGKHTLSGVFSFGGATRNRIAIFGDAPQYLVIFSPFAYYILYSVIYCVHFVFSYCSQIPPMRFGSKHPEMRRAVNAMSFSIPVIVEK